MSAAKRECLGRDLLVTTEVFSDFFPALFNILQSLVNRDFACKITGKFGVENDRAYFARPGSSCRTPCSAVESAIDGTDIVLGKRLRHTSLDEQVGAGQLRQAIRVVTRRTNGHVDTRLR